MFMIALGIALLIIGVYLLILYPVQRAQLARRTAQTDGYVTEVRKKIRRKASVTYIIDFEYTADGVRQELKNVKWPLEPEKRVTIAYNPDKPADAHVKEFRATDPKVFLIIGAILTVIAVILIVVGVVS